jgi:hypothetical protein
MSSLVTAAPDGDGLIHATKVRDGRPGRAAGEACPAACTCMRAAPWLSTGYVSQLRRAPVIVASTSVRLPAVVGTLKGYSKVLEYEYRVKIAALVTLKRYSIISLTLYLEWYSAYSIVGSDGPH